MEEPIFTGRYGRDHDEVCEHGKRYMVVSTLKEQYIFGPGLHPLVIDSDTIEGIADPWIEHITMSAYNSEDAYRNANQAHEQWRAWFDGEPGWMTAPFKDMAGVIDESEGGDGAYAAYPPDDTAKHRPTRPDLFFEDSCVIPAGFTFAAKAA